MDYTKRDEIDQQFQMQDRNPFRCTCEQHELWQWLRDHQKILESTSGGHASDAPGLQCQHPPELRGLDFLEMEPSHFCSAPFALELVINDIKPFSVLVSWQSRNTSAFNASRIVYRESDGEKKVHSKLLDSSNRNSVRLVGLSPNTRYRICVVASNYGTENPFTPSSPSTVSATTSLVDSSVTRCSEVRTIDMLLTAEGTREKTVVDESSGAESGDGDIEESFFKRRMGLVIGACLGFFVFVAMVTVLGYFKLKKERQQQVKRDQPLQDYVSFQNFTIHRQEGLAFGPIIIGSTSFDS